MFSNKNGRNPCVFSSLTCNCFKVAATLFKILEIDQKGTFKHNFSPMTILMLDNDVFKPIK